MTPCICYIAKPGKSMCPDITPEMKQTTMRGMVVYGFEVFDTEFKAIQGIRKSLKMNGFVTIYKAIVNPEDIVQIGCLDLVCDYLTKNCTFERDIHIKLDHNLWKYFK